MGPHWNRATPGLHEGGLMRCFAERDNGIYFCRSAAPRWCFCTIHTTYGANPHASSSWESVDRLLRDAVHS